MLARLQRFTTLGLLALTAAWAWHFWQAGRPAWALLGALLIAGSYALVLGLEFMLLYWVHGDDPTPRASPALLLRAWWGEVCSGPLVFCWRQPFRSRRWPDQLPAAGAGIARPAQRGLLLVHGFVCNRGVWNHWLRRLTQQGRPWVAVNLEPVFGSIDGYAERIEHAVQRLEAATGLPPVIVAHSMGGLAVRRWWAEQADSRRVHHIVTLGTPHRGTWLARWALTGNSRQMRQLSGWLGALAQREAARQASHFTCFYSHCDNIVFPPATATLPGAKNVHLSGVAHLHMVERSEPWAEVLARLDDPLPAQAAETGAAVTAATATAQPAFQPGAN